MNGLDIKKIDDKPMEIHTKKKAKLHIHESKEGVIKGKDVYVRQTVDESGRNLGNSFQIKNTKHSYESIDNGNSRRFKGFKEWQESRNASIKIKDSNLYITR